MKNILSILSKMALKILILEKTIFPAPQEQLRVLSLKEEKLMRILELAWMELYVSEVKITNHCGSLMRNRKSYKIFGDYGSSLYQKELMD